MSNKPYKKRVIAADSDESQDDEPLIKRVKLPTPDPAADSAIAYSAPGAHGAASNGDTVMNGATEALVAPVAALKNKQDIPKKKLSVFDNGVDSNSDSDNDSETPLIDSVASNKKKNGNGNGKSKREASPSSSSEEEKPLAQIVKSEKKKTAPRASSSRASTSSSKTAKREDDDDDDDHESLSEPSASDSDVPLKKKKAPAKKKVTTTTKSKKETSDTKPKASSRVKKEDSAAPTKAKAKGKGKAKKDEDAESKAEDGDSEDDTYKWWENQDNSDTKWKTLEHNGVLFPPEYEPHGIRMKYNGKQVKLAPEAEEVASFFAAILETDYPKNPTFVSNFFADFLKILVEYPPLDGTQIKDFDKCDFTPIFAYLETEKAKKKELTTAQKKALKAAKDEVEDKYKTCLLDGRKEKVGNFRIEPPGLFRGRGEHPKTGMLKTRVAPEQITINIGKDAQIPPAPAGHKWNNVVHDDKVTWLATWKENINGNVKYVFLAAGSSLKGQSDHKKFEKARALKAHVDRIRSDYTADLKSKEMATRQRATAVYLIDRFALRAGNEKGEDEADTVGCCSLRYEHVTLTPPNKVTFDFLGKDSIRYVNEVEVDEQVFKNLKIFKKEPKTVGDLLFDRLSTQVVNRYLTSYMEGLTAKVFRTYNASWTFVQQLKNTPKDASVADKILAYNRANRLVAVLCNHQRSVSKGHGAAMEKMVDKIRGLKYQRMKLRKTLLSVADKPKMYKKEFEEESDLEQDWIDEHEKNLVVLEREKIRKKFDKEQKKLAEENEKPMKDEELETRLKAADELAKSIKHDRKEKYTTAKGNEDKLVTQLRKLDERILVQKTNATDKDEGKEISLGTSKINYIDPRISVQWCKEHDVPLAKIFSKTLLEKFTWAVDSVDADFDW
ncbi:DNA topoisomerase 1 [Sporobolomyces koalae]|uniref:DNA topoisomerase 1 n=1 Tax=Sporobolomyces koalae TaxID=500713 RepID=UPI00317CB476